MKKGHWAKIVEPLNEAFYVKNKFSSSFDRLFPGGWIPEPRTGDFREYDADVLQPIRNHIQAIPEAQRASYSQELRRRIKSMILSEWEYLPAVRAHKIWPIQPSVGSTRRYRLATRFG
jgi:hypothetical protein